MHKDKVAIIIFLIAICAFGTYYLLANPDYYGFASIWGIGEKEFSEPVDVVWRGEIISTMAGGSCIGLKGEFDNYQWAIACLLNADSNELWKFEGMVTVIGKWLGISCAYKNTIFGECVPDVRIEKIEQ